MELDKAYNDNPEDMDRLVESLSPVERRAFDKGYVFGLCQLLEQITTSQSKIQRKMMDPEVQEDAEALMQLQSRMILLDVYEKFYSMRIKTVVERENLHL